MFITVNKTHFFILPEEKTPQDIVSEIFLRMNKQSLSKRERADITEQVIKQLPG